VSQENLEIVRRLVEHVQAGEWDEAMSMISADIVLDVSRFPDGGVYEGRDGYEAFFRRWFGTWNDLHISAERFFDAGDEVVVFLKLAGRGKGSGVSVTLESADVWTVHGGKAVRLVGYFDRGEALEAAGLSE
jgi:ketosteroid isomerase-like protein